MTSATVKVEKATSDLLIAPDWSLNMDICDSANSDSGQTKEVIKAVKKRLHHKSTGVQLLTLTLLETLMKNCGDYVHQQVYERDILQDMLKLVRKKSDAQVRDKILVLIDSWQEAFGGAQGKFPQYFWAYAELKGDGVIFPTRSRDDAPIITPPATHASPSSFPMPRPPPQAMYNPPSQGYGIPQPGFGTPQPGYGIYGMPRAGFGIPQPGYGMPQPGYGMPQPEYGIPQPGYGMPVNASVRLDEAIASERIDLGSSELDSMQSVMELLSDMLRAVNPTDPQAVKDEIISELVIQCRSNEKKLMGFITTTRDEQLLEQSLELNDKLQSLLAKHDAIASGSAVKDEIRDVPIPAVVDSALTPVQSTSNVARTPVPSTSNVALTPVPSTTHVAPTPVQSTSNVAPTPVPSTSHVAVTSGAVWVDEGGEEDDDEFAQLARRSSKLKTVNTEVPSPTTNGSGSSSTIPNNPLALPDPPAPVKTSPTQEDEITRLLNLSLTLPPHSSPDPPLTSPIQNPIQNRISSPITSPTFLATSPDINSLQWAPPQTNSSSSPVTSPPYLNKENNYNIVQWTPPPPETSSYPPPPWASEPDPVPNSNYPQYNNNVMRPVEQTRLNALGAPPRPSYVSSSTFFGDLVELRNPDGSLRSTGSPSFNYNDINIARK